MREGRVVGLKCRFGGAVERGEEKKNIEEDVWKKKKEKRIKERLKSILAPFRRRLYFALLT